MASQQYIPVFQQSITDYHERDDINAAINNPFSADSLEHLLYLKNWIDTVQWHLEDIIRNPDIDPSDALLIKRRIDSSNQHRTDVVEFIDGWFLKRFNDVQPAPDATINTESVAWAIDRLSILELKIYHMRIEAARQEATPEHRESCSVKLETLLLQRADLSLAIDQLIEDIAGGRKYMKVYKQMKMYNDASLNPVLYGQKRGSL